MSEIHMRQHDKGVVIVWIQAGAHQQNVGFSPGFSEAIALALHAAQSRHIPEDRVFDLGRKVTDFLLQ